MSAFSLSVPFRMANTRMANQSAVAFNQTDVVTFLSPAPNKSIMIPTRENAYFLRHDLIDQPMFPIDPS